MIFKHQTVLSLTVAMFAVLISAPALAQNNRPPRKSVVMAFSQVEAKAGVRELYVAIMGGIANPGTYRLDPSEFKLNSVVKRAGGLSPEATRTIRVIRQGRLNHQVSYTEESEKSDSRLEPGDLIIVDSNQTPDALGKVTEFVSEPTTIRAGYEVVTQPGVQVALLNVLDYPVVITLPPEEATPVSIIDRLGQPAELLANSHVINPNGRARTSETSSSSVILASGSAVVFDRGFVNRDRLPATLPKPIESDIAAGAQSGLIGSPHGQSAELRHVGQQMFISSTHSNEDSQISHRASTELIPSNQSQPEQSFEEQRIDLSVPALDANPRVATVPFTGVRRITKSSTGNLRSDTPVIEQIPETNDAANENNVAVSSNAPAFSLDEPTESPSSSSSIPLAIVTLAISGTLIGAAVIFRRRLESQSKKWNKAPFEFITSHQIVDEPHPAPKSQTDEKTLLERMIKNELPLMVEQIEFPSEIALQGRIAPKSILRVDGPQDIIERHGPHFSSSDSTGAETSLQQVIAQTDDPESMPRRPHFMTMESPRVEASTDSSNETRNLTSSRGSERSNAPLASALFDLQRGVHS